MLFGTFAKGYKTVRFRIKAYIKVGACTEDIEDDTWRRTIISRSNDTSNFRLSSYFF